MVLPNFAHKLTSRVADKSPRAILFTYLFIVFTLLSIFMCMTIVACAQKITTESNRCMMFDVEDHLEKVVVRGAAAQTEEFASCSLC